MYFPFEENKAGQDKKFRNITRQLDVIYGCFYELPIQFLDVLRSLFLNSWFCFVTI